MGRDILKWTIRDKHNASGDKLQENFDAFSARFPLAPEDIEEVYSSTIIWNVPIPEVAFPGPNGDGNNTIADISYTLGKLSFNPLYTQAFGLSLVRDWYTNALLEQGKRDIGWVSPCTWLGKRAFVVCDGFNDRVYIVTPSGGSNFLIPQKLAEFEVGDGPQHAVATADGAIYVLCNGTNLSTADASIWRVGPNGAAEVITSTALDTTDGISGFRKGAVNMNGNFLYAISANKTSGIYDRYIQVDLTRKVVTSSGEFDYSVADPPVAGGTVTSSDELVDIMVYYPDGRSANATDAWVLVLQESMPGAAQSALWAIKGDDGTDAYAFPSITSGADGVCRKLNFDLGKFCIQFQTSIVYGLDSGSGPDTFFYSLDPEDQEGTGLVGKGFQQTLQVSNTGLGIAMIGSACATDTGIYWVQTNGDVVYQMAGDAQARVFTPRAGWNSSPDEKTGIAFDGRTLLIQATNASGDGESVFMRPF